MGQDDGAGAQIERAFDHFARKHRQAVHGAAALVLIGDQRVLGVEKQHPEAFGFAMADGCAAIFDDPVARIQHRALAHIGARQPNAGLAHRLEQRRGAVADALGFSQIVGRRR